MMSTKRMYLKSGVLICVLLAGVSGDAVGQDLHRGSSLNPDTLSVSDTTVRKVVLKPGVRPFIIPAIMLGYGATSFLGNNFIRRLDYSTNAELREDHPSFALSIDDQLRYAPAIAVYALDLVGVKAKNNVLDRTIMLAGSYAVVSITAGTLKGFSNRLRPNGSNDHSFPSGHTSLVFMTAEFLHQEYKDQSIWYSIGGYAIATGTGVLRLYNNAHWVSDVVAGAGLGILSTKVTYLVYPYIKRKLLHGKSANVMISPGYQNGNMSFNLIKRF